MDYAEMYDLAEIAANPDAAILAGLAQNKIALMSYSELQLVERVLNPDDKIILCRRLNGCWHLVRTVAIQNYVNGKDGWHYEVTGWRRSIKCPTHHSPLDRDDRIESIVDRKTLERCLKTTPGVCPVHLGASFCTLCFDVTQQNPKEFIVTDKPIDTTKLDTTKPIIVCSDGTTHQADHTLASAKQLAKQLVDNKAITATIYVPHTKFERLLPPVKATRINTKF